MSLKLREKVYGGWRKMILEEAFLSPERKSEAGTRWMMQSFALLNDDNA